MQPSSHKGAIEKIYSTVNTAKSWPEVLNYIKHDLNSTCGFMAIRTKADIQPHSFYDIGFDSHYFDRYQQHFFEVDLWTQGLFNNRLNYFHANHYICDENQFTHSEIYHDFAKPAQIRFGIGALLCDKNSDLITQIGIMRPKEFERYDDQEIQHANALLPHIQHSISLLHLIEKQQQQILNLESVLYASEHPILICKGKDTVILHNDLFEQLIFHAKELSIKKNKLLVTNQDLKNALRIRISECLHSIEYNQTLSAPFYSYIGSELYKITVKPWLYREMTSCGIIEHPSVIINFKPSASKLRLDIAIIQSHFGLTPAESQVCELLTQGMQPDKIAHTRGSHVATVRQQLKSCLAKTQTSTQTELVCLMLRLFLTR
ncbi:helix-turn-helix transcriptional regulator [Shewanella gaetbuli]